MTEQKFSAFPRLSGAPAIVRGTIFLIPVRFSSSLRFLKWRDLCGVQLLLSAYKMQKIEVICKAVRCP